MEVLVFLADNGKGKTGSRSHLSLPHFTPHLLGGEAASLLMQTLGDNGKEKNGTAVGHAKKG